MEEPMSTATITGFAGGTDDLKATLEVRMKEIKTFDVPQTVSYERAYRRKWKELQEQLKQDVEEEEVRVQKRLQDEHDVEHQAQRRFELRKSEIGKKITERQLHIARLQKEIAEAECKTRQLLPEFTNDVSAAVVHIAGMLREVQKERDSRPSSDSRQCIACQNHVREHLFLPCRHMVMCGECSGKVTSCPMCRAAIETRVSALWG